VARDLSQSALGVEQLTPIARALPEQLKFCSKQRKNPMGDSIAIARQESSDITISIDAHINSDGGLRLEGNDVGNRVKELLGDSDYEYLIDVPASEIGRLLLLLLKEKYDGDTEAVSKFKTFCESNGIAHSFFNWV